jgi:FAD/FMN-containing dehydrogenase
LNPGFSSTPGVQIAMTRFNEVVYDSSTETVEIGSGLIFDEVYEALAPYNRSIAGGRVAGIGVGGFLLGGGEHNMF